MRYIAYFLAVCFFLAGIDYLKSFDPRGLNENTPPHVATAHAAGMLSGAVMLLASCVLFAGAVVAGSRRRRPRRRRRAKTSGTWELAEPQQPADPFGS